MTAMNTPHRGQDMCGRRMVLLRIESKRVSAQVANSRFSVSPSILVVVGLVLLAMLAPAISRTGYRCSILHSRQDTDARFPISLPLSIPAHSAMSTVSSSCVETLTRLLKHKLVRAAASLRLRGAGKVNRGGRSEGRKVLQEEPHSAPGQDETESFSGDGSMFDAESGKQSGKAGAGQMVNRGDIMTADQCVGHAEAALEAGDYEDAVDFLQVALEDIKDEHGEDAPESVPLLLLYAKALIEMETQAATAAAASTPAAAATQGGAATAAAASLAAEAESTTDLEGESSGPEDAQVAAWRALEDVKLIIHRASDPPRETKELADAHELQAVFAGRSILMCPAFAGKTAAERHSIARHNLETCLRIRLQVFPEQHAAVQRVRHLLSLSP